MDCAGLCASALFIDVCVCVCVCGHVCLRACVRLCVCVCVSGVVWRPVSLDNKLLYSWIQLYFDLSSFCGVIT